MDKLFNNINNCLLSIEVALEHLYDEENIVDNKDYWRSILVQNKMDVDKYLNNFLKNF